MFIEKVMNSTKKNGFTLIELLIVIVILGLLASLVAPAMFSKVDSSKIKTAETQLRMLESSINTYRLDVGAFPDALQELIKSDKKGWDGPYLPKDVPLDPWGNAYVYAKPGEQGKPYGLRSLGRDGRQGGEGDDADVILY